MNWKILLSLFIIIAITGLLIFSEKGRTVRARYLDPYLKKVGSYFEGITGIFKKHQVVNRTLDVTITASPDILNGMNFDLEGNSFDGELKYETVSVSGQNINVKGSDKIKFNVNSMTGSISIDASGKMIISGQAKSVEFDSIIINSKSEKEMIDFSLIGTRTSFSLSNIEIERLIFPETSGLLRISDWPPMQMENDNLDITNFKGDIEQEGNSITVSGKVERISLNGIDLSLKT